MVCKGYVVGLVHLGLGVRVICYGTWFIVRVSCSLLWYMVLLYGTWYMVMIHCHGPTSWYMVLCYDILLWHMVHGTLLWHIVL